MWTKQRRQKTRPAPTQKIRRKSTPGGMPQAAGVSEMHPAVSARLRVGDPHDLQEQEADRVARAVMRMPQRSVEKMPILEGGAGGKATGTGEQLEALRGRGQPLSQRLNDFFGPRLRHDFSHVRIHIDARAARLAQSMQARAFAIGRDVVFGAGEFAPDSERGRELMAHELTHVVQQERGSAQSSPGTIQRQPTPEQESPEFPDFPNLALKLEDDIGQNLFDYGHHFYRLATLYPDQPQLLQEAFGRYALGKNVLETGYRFLGLDQGIASHFALGTGVLFKGLTFATTGEVTLDFQFDVGHGLKLETNFSMGMNPDDLSQVRNVDVGLGVVGHF